MAGSEIEYLKVDGERFEVRSSWGEPGRYEYSWLNGKNSDDGLVSQTSDGRGLTSEAHETNIRSFLGGIRPAMGQLTEGLEHREEPDQIDQ